jgi:hypothetical protein
MPRTQRLVLLGALAVFAAVSAGRPALAGTITAGTYTSTAGSTAGNATISVTNNLPGGLNLIAKTASITGAGFIDTLLPYSASATTNVYYVSEGITNSMVGANVTSVTIELGKTVGGVFTVFGNASTLRFDQTAPYAPTATNGFTPTLGIPTLAYTGGLIRPSLTANFSFGIDIPNPAGAPLTSPFTLREVFTTAVIPVPEPSSMSLLGIGLSMLIGVRRLFKRTSVV